MSSDIGQHIEALIFSSKQSISVEDILNALEETFDIEFSQDKIHDYLTAIETKYDAENSVFELRNIADGYLFISKPAYHNTIVNHLKLNTDKKLGKSAMETLAIIAYRQPTTKTEIESIRGVSSDYSIKKLLEKELIDIEGRSDGPGRPLLYSTSKKFMNYFGLKDMSELPRLKEIVRTEPSTGDVVLNGEQKTD